MRQRILGISLLVLVFPACGGLAQSHDPAVGLNLADVKFVALPGLPGCALNAVQSGDPATGPSIILAKIAAGCTVPWHWHTPDEHLMMVSGSARLESRHAKPFVLKAGGFARMPGKHVHQFRCLEDCVMYVQSGAPFDIHYVDAHGREISPQTALRKPGAAPARR
jgi:quercetin dioxygenase-like cupin family protein